MDGLSELNLDDGTGSSLTTMESSLIPALELLGSEFGEFSDVEEYFDSNLFPNPFPDGESVAFQGKNTKNAPEVAPTGSAPKNELHSKIDSKRSIEDIPPTETSSIDQDEAIQQQTTDDQPSMVVGGAAGYKQQTTDDQPSMVNGGAFGFNDDETDEAHGLAASYFPPEETIQEDSFSHLLPDDQLPLPVFDLLLEDIEEIDAKQEGAKADEPKKPQVDLEVDEMQLADYVRYADASELIHFVSEVEWRIKFQQKSNNNAPIFAGVILKEYANCLKIRNNRYRSNLDWNANGILGKGAEGQVFQAMDNSTLFQFAVKEMVKDVRVDGIRSWLEVNSSEYVPRLIGITLQQTMIYIFQEFVPQKNFHEVLQKTVPRPSLKALPIAINLIEQTINIHKHGVIFRDIQSKNILLDPFSSEIWIVDFGLSRPNEELRNGTREPVGVWLYWSPRIIKGESRQSFRSDGYAIGMVLYELLSGGKRLFTLKEKDIVLKSLPVCGPPFVQLEALSEFPLVSVKEGEVIKELIFRLWSDKTAPLSAHLVWLKDRQEALGIEMIDGIHTAMV